MVEVKQYQNTDVITKQNTSIFQVQITIVSDNTNFNVNIEDITNLTINTHTNIETNYSITNKY